MSSAFDSREVCDKCAGGRERGAAAGEDDEELAEHLFFGKASSAALPRRVFECCRLPVSREGYVFVRLRLRSEGKTSILQVVAERNDGAPMTVADCATLSRLLSHVLEGEGLASKPTRLEVSSPGIERPLTRLRDFRRFVGSEIVLELGKKVGNAPRSFRATLVGVEGGSVIVRTASASFAEERLSIPIEDVVKARLVFVSVAASKSSGFVERE